MKLNVKMIAALLILCTACSNVKETPKGMTYTVIRKGDGIAGKPGQFMMFTLLLKDAKDSAWFDTRKIEFPEPIRIPDTTNLKKEEGLSEIFRYLTKGDSVTFKIKAEDLYKKTLRQPMPPKTDPKSDFSVAIGINNIISQNEFMKLRKEVTAKQKEKFEKNKVAQLGKDTVTIDSLLRIKNIKALKTPSGLRYNILKPGKGPVVARGKKVKIEYAGYLTNGKYFDTNIESIGKAHSLKRPTYAPWDLEAGTGKVIPGFDEAFLLMNKGEKITVYIPSTLAYGPQKVNEDIGPNAILIFDIDMMDITDGGVQKKNK
jgi:FKBP-type peptidyl-prolyl cis-trans isomerase FkpA